MYNEAHIQSVPRETPERAADDIVEISHCREGRLEYSINGAVCYLEPGDLAIARTSSVSGESYFPLRHYHGQMCIRDRMHTFLKMFILCDKVRHVTKSNGVIHVLSVLLSLFVAFFLTFTGAGAQLGPVFAVLFHALWLIPIWLTSRLI